MITTKCIGELIEEFDIRNKDGKVNEFYGINVKKEFMPTLADTSTVDSSKYKIIKKDDFVFSGMQTGRDKKRRIGLFKMDEGIVSPAYTTFKIKDRNVIRPEFFFMNFLRDEMDRYGWFLSDSSIRANLDWERFLDIKISFPNISIQDKYISIYEAIIRVKRLNERIQKICPVLIRKANQDGGVKS